MDAEEWIDRLKPRIEQYGKLGKIWLPHDARAKTFAAKHSAVEIFAKEFGANKIAITPDSKKADRINAARVLTPHVEFSDKCAKGLEGLRAWSYEYNEQTKTFSSDPKHDWASHDGDGYSYGCLIMQMTKPKLVPDPMKLTKDYTINDFIRASEMGAPTRRRI